jgi:phage shock protein A
MGIFTRFRDIVSSNLNAILDKAEDPEKIVRLMIQEMEDTLIEVKSNCAGVIAGQKRLEREQALAQADVADWEAKARLAVDKGRDDLARAALAEKQAQQRRVDSLTKELAHAREAVTTYQEDIAQLETKLNDARDKQRSIIQRRAAAASRLETQTRIRTIDTSAAFARFEAFENGIDRLEAEAHLVNGLRPRTTPPPLRDQFAELAQQDEIERELERLKKGAGEQA